MALIKCRECGKQISKKADKCPACGAPVGGGKIGCGGVVVLVIFVAVLAAVLVEPPADSSSSSGQDRPAQSADRSPPPPPEPPPPVLRLESFSCGRTAGDTAELVARVTNLADEPKAYVRLVASFYTDDGEHIGSGFGFTDIDPLMPGQTSPVQVLGPRNPRYSRCGIDGFQVGTRQVRWENADD